MIPKKIHYFWFGGGSKNSLLEKCIASWRISLPDYEIIEWNETNYDVNKNPFTHKAFTEKRWAFLSDFARLDVLNQHGGIYLDTDMEVLKSLTNFLDIGFFAGMESATHLNGSIIGCVPEHWLTKEIITAYEQLTEFSNI